MNGFQKCFILFVAGSFVIIFNRKAVYLPSLTSSQLALKLRTIEPQVKIYWFVYNKKRVVEQQQFKKYILKQYVSTGVDDVDQSTLIYRPITFSLITGNVCLERLLVYALCM